MDILDNMKTANGQSGIAELYLNDLLTAFTKHG
jgi:hypothetical protein